MTPPINGETARKRDSGARPTQLTSGSGPLPIRIYALAKQLKLDSKELVDICTKAGVTGKGSALASLTDEETARVMAYITGGKGGRTGGPAGPVRRSETAAGPAFRREDYIAPAGTVSGKVPVLLPPSPRSPF